MSERVKEAEYKLVWHHTSLNYKNPARNHLTGYPMGVYVSHPKQAEKGAKRGQEGIKKCLHCADGIEIPPHQP